MPDFGDLFVALNPRDVRGRPRPNGATDQFDGAAGGKGADAAHDFHGDRAYCGELWASMLLATEETGGIRFVAGLD